MSDSESGYSYSTLGSNVSASDSSSESEEEAIDKKKENNVGFDTELEPSKALISELRRIRDLSRGMDDVLGRLRLMYGRTVSAEEARGESEGALYAGERQRRQWQPSNCIVSPLSTEIKPEVSPLSASVPPASETVSHRLNSSGVPHKSNPAGGYNECTL